MDLRVTVECSLEVAVAGAEAPEPGSAPNSPNSQINTELSWRQHDKPWFGEQNYDYAAALPCAGSKPKEEPVQSRAHEA